MGSVRSCAQDGLELPSRLASLTGVGFVNDNGVLASGDLIRPFAGLTLLHSRGGIGGIGSRDAARPEQRGISARS